MKGQKIKTLLKPYFLFIGARHGYKNFIRLVEAFGQSGLAKDFNLRVVSPNPSDKFNTEEMALLRRYNLENSVDLRLSISEIDLRESYSSSTALVYPSEYEGFGLPILEAMATGTLVAAGNVASIPEIAEDLALYFDPRSIDSIKNALLHIATMPETERLSRISRGIAHANKFTWKRCQLQTAEAISRLLHS